MELDMYIRNPDDPNFKPGIVEIWDDLEMFIQQIEMVLMTERGEILGEPDFGANLEYYVHGLNINSGRIERLVQNQIVEYCTLASKFPFTVSMSFYKGDVRDIGLLEIEIDNTIKFNVVVS